MKNNKGITLVAVAAAIIIMLILAGIIIFLLVGNNGVFTKAIESEKDYSKAEIGEAFEQLRNTKFMEAYATANENSVDISEYFNEANMLAYLTGNDGSEEAVAYMTAAEDYDYISIDALGGETQIYRVYVLNVPEISEEVTEYGKGSLSEGDVFTLEVVVNEENESEIMSTGSYELKYYAEGVTNSDEAEVLTTIMLYATNST